MSFLIYQHIWTEMLTKQERAKQGSVNENCYMLY